MLFESATARLSLAAAAACVSLAACGGGDDAAAAATPVAAASSPAIGIKTITINQVEKKDIFIRLCDEKGAAVISWKNEGHPGSLAKRA